VTFSVQSVLYSALHCALIGTEFNGLVTVFQAWSWLKLRDVPDQYWAEKTLRPNPHDVRIKDNETVCDLTNVISVRPYARSTRLLRGWGQGQRGSHILLFEPKLYWFI